MIERKPLAKTPRLLRMVVSNVCNYNCIFCDWKKHGHNAISDNSDLSPEDYAWIVQNFVDNGCKRAHFTGGEPLLLSQDRLTRMIKAVAVVKELESFWITTNGYMLHKKDLCENMAYNGLKTLSISIGASDNEGYSQYTGSKINSFNLVIEGIKNAIEAGITVKIGVPIFKNGINSYEKLMELIKRLDNIGIYSIAYFSLYKGDENKEKFDEEFINSKNITMDFYKDSDWQYTESITGQKLFLSKKYNCRIIVPDLPETKNMSCSKYNCGKECQGIYSVYLTRNEKNETIIRACNRYFNDKANEFVINQKIIQSRDSSALQDILHNVWGWAYYE